jgi:prophage DNA circulation protein
MYENIRQASFRGVPFGVLDASDSRGRNIVIHEFPLRDKIFVEDLGRAKRTINLTAFILNPDYESKRDALIEALEEPGPGTLVHPWLGSFSVNLINAAELSHSATDIGICSFKLQFAEVDPPEAPGPGLFWPDLTALWSVAARLVIGASLTAAFLLKPVKEEALSLAHSWAQGLSKVMGAVYLTAVTFPFVSDVVASFFDQAIKHNGLVDLVKDFWPVRNYRQGIGPEIAYAEAEGLLKLSLQTPLPVIPPFMGTVRRQMAQNSASIQVYQREISGIAGLEAMAWAKPASTNEAQSLRDLAMDVTDYLLNNASSADVFREVQRVGVAAQKALAEAAKQAPEIVIIEELRPGQALTIAWRKVLSEAKSGRPSDVVQDLIRRNRIRHPGFVPAGALEVLRV